MKKVIMICCVVLMCVNVGSADVVRGIDIDFVTIGNAGNAPDTQVMRDVINSSNYPNTEGDSFGFRVASLAIQIEVLNPNGGEELIAGQTHTIDCSSSAVISEVSIEYCDAKGVSWDVIDPCTPNDGEYDWTVPEVTSNQCLVRISDVTDPCVFDVSDDVFTIYECQLSSIGKDADLDDNCKIDIVDFSMWTLQWLNNGNPFDDGYTEPLPVMWVYIDDPGVPSHEGFTGFMSKYETTNAQYCAYLNAAKASGDVTVDGDYVKGSSGPYSGLNYYYLVGPGWTGGGATNGGAARINWTGSSFTVDSGFDNHPVSNVSWYGSTAFASYYGWRLPTEWEWQAVADYNGSYTYGCGSSLYDAQKFLAKYRSNGDNSYAPNNLPYHPWVVHGTSEVGHFGTFGYGMSDMAGNVWEWTSTAYASYRVIRGGGWGIFDDFCTVSFRNYCHPDLTSYRVGFRVCR